MTRPAPTFRGRPLRAAESGVYYLVSPTGHAVTVWRLSRWWKPWRGLMGDGKRAVRVSAWTAQGAVDQLAKTFTAWCTARLARDIGLVATAARTPACDLCGRAATRTTTNAHPEGERRWLCASCALDVEYVHELVGGPSIAWEPVNTAPPALPPARGAKA